MRVSARDAEGGRLPVPVLRGVEPITHSAEYLARWTERSARLRRERPEHLDRRFGAAPAWVGRARYRARIIQIRARGLGLNPAVVAAHPVHAEIRLTAQ